MLGDRARAAVEARLAVLGWLSLLALRQRQEPVPLGAQHTGASPEPALVVLEALLFLAQLLLTAADRLGAVAQALLQLFDLGQPVGVGRPVADVGLLLFLVCATPGHARSTVNDLSRNPHRDIDPRAMRVGRLVVLAGLAMLIAASVSYAHIHGPHGIGGDKYRNHEPARDERRARLVRLGQHDRLCLPGRPLQQRGGSNVGSRRRPTEGRPGTRAAFPARPSTRLPRAWARVSDPVVAYDPEHNVWMIGTLGHQRPGLSAQAVLTSRSTDGGLTWQPLWSRWSVAPGHVLRQELARLRHLGVRARTTATATRSGTTTASGQPDADEHVNGRRPDVGPRRFTHPRSVSGLGGQPVVQPNGTVVVPYTANYGFDPGVPLAGRWRFLDFGNVPGRTAVVCAGRGPAFATRRCRPPRWILLGKVWVAWHDCAFRYGLRDERHRLLDVHQRRDLDARRRAFRSTRRRARSTTSCPASALTRSAHRGGSASSTTTTRTTPAVCPRVS